MATTELLITNVRVVRPDVPAGSGPEPLDIAVNDGVIVRVAPDLPRDDTATVVDGHGRLAFRLNDRIDRRFLAEYQAAGGRVEEAAVIA